MRFKMCQSSAVQRWIDLGECASVVQLSEHLFSFQFLVFSFSWRVRRSVSKPVIASQPDQSQLKWAPTDWKRSKLKKWKGLSSLCDDYQMEVVAMFNISLWCQGEAAVSCPVFIATRLQNIKEGPFFLSFNSGCPAIFSVSCQEILGQKLFTPQKWSHFCKSLCRQVVCSVEPTKFCMICTYSLYRANSSSSSSMYCMQYGRALIHRTSPAQGIIKQRKTREQRVSEFQCQRLRQWMFRSISFPRFLFAVCTLVLRR